MAETQRRLPSQKADSMLAMETGVKFLEKLAEDLESSRKLNLLARLGDRGAAAETLGPAYHSSVSRLKKEVAAARQDFSKLRSLGTSLESAKSDSERDRALSQIQKTASSLENRIKSCEIRADEAAYLLKQRAKNAAAVNAWVFQRTVDIITLAGIAAAPLAAPEEIALRAAAGKGISSVLERLIVRGAVPGALWGGAIGMGEKAVEQDAMRSVPGHRASLSEIAVSGALSSALGAAAGAGLSMGVEIGSKALPPLLKWAKSRWNSLPENVRLQLESERGSLGFEPAPRSWLQKRFRFEFSEDVKLSYLKSVTAINRELSSSKCDAIIIPLRGGLPIVRTMQLVASYEKTSFPKPFTFIPTSTHPAGVRMPGDAQAINTMRRSAVENAVSQISSASRNPSIVVLDEVKSGASVVSMHKALSNELARARKAGKIDSFSIKIIALTDSAKHTKEYSSLLSQGAVSEHYVKKLFTMDNQPLLYNLDASGKILFNPKSLETLQDVLKELETTYLSSSFPGRKTFK